MSTVDRKVARRLGCARIVLLSISVSMGLCVALIGISAWSNRDLPAPPAQTQTLSDVDQARVEEALRLKSTLGEDVWPGWGTMPIPLLIYNSDYGFLIGMDAPPDGWDALPDPIIDGSPVYRQPVTDDFQAFAVPLSDDVYAGGMGTKYELDHGFTSQFEDLIPAPLNQAFPYRLFILSTEQYISAILHESFHAYQAMEHPDRFADAESAYADAEAYWATQADARALWQAEINTLVQALVAETDDEAAELVRQFFDQRAARRAETGIDSDLVLYEQRLEWLEGLAKYVEIGIWETAARSADYTSLPALGDDPYFHDYANFDNRWQSERITMRNMPNQGGDTRFYYTGMAQARLLDRLLPGWQSQIMEPGIWLDDLLAETIR